MPADTDPLAWRPTDNSFPNGINSAGDFVAWNARVLNSGPVAFLHQRIAVANAARRDFNSNSSWRQLRYWPLDKLKRSIRTRNLGNAHCGHKSIRCFFVDSEFTL